jgi:hypothetical protein
MNKEAVGMENLPNVFIEKITIYPFPLNTQAGILGRKEIVVTLAMYDHLPKRSWRGRPEIPGLKVKVAFIENEQIERINNPLISLFNFSEVSNGVFVEHVSEFEIEAGRTYIDDEDNRFSKFKFDITYETRPRDFINVYAACFIDDLGFEDNIYFDKFYGPMSGEIIYAGGVINKQSGYFYHPDTNKEYAGPVHQHPNSGYMVGSEHSPSPHAKLRYVQQANSKIIEIKDPEELLGESEGEVPNGGDFNPETPGTNGGPSPGTQPSVPQTDTSTGGY